MTKRARNTLVGVLCCLFAISLFFAVWTMIFRVTAVATDASAQNVSSSTVAVHDPSIVLAYEDENGNTYPDAATAQSEGGVLPVRFTMCSAHRIPLQNLMI